MDRAEMQLPEGRLVEAALKASRMSARQAAEHIGMSDSRLRHIMRGFQPVGRGEVIQVVAPAETLARIAYGLGITADQLRDVDRADAAEAFEAAASAEGSHHIRWSIGAQERAQARVEAREWLASSMDARPPKSLLRVLPNEDLLAEVRRRMDEGTREMPPAKPLSVVPDEVSDAVAAHEEEVPTVGEQGESETP